MNTTLHELFEQDRHDHGRQLAYGTPEYFAMRDRDGERRRAADRIVADNPALEPVDLYHAAWLFNHGDSVEDGLKAYTLARRAAEGGHRPARWLHAAAYDRWLMYQGKPQKYGTQYVPDGKRYRLWDVDSSTTDADRAAWDVPSLAAQREREVEMTRNAAQPPIDAAPRWLRDAIERWNRADPSKDDDTKDRVR